MVIIAILSSSVLVVLMAYLLWEPLKKVPGQTKTGLAQTREWVGKMAKEWQKRTWEKILALLKKARTRLEPSTPEAKEKWNDALATAKRVVITIFVLALIGVAIYPLSWFEIPKEGAFNLFFKWAFLGLWFVFLLVILATSILCWYAGWKKLAPILFAVFSTAALSTLAMFLFTQLGDRYLPDRKFWKGHTEIVWWISALVVIVIAVLSWKWISGKSMSAFKKLEDVAPNPKIFLGIVIVFFVLNAGLYWYSPGLWLNAWWTEETRTADVLVSGWPFLTSFSFKQSGEFLVWWSFWAFWLAQVLGIFVIYHMVTTSEKNGVLVSATIAGILFLGIAFLLANNRPGKFKEKMETVDISLDEFERTEENAREMTGVLSWQMPEGMKNLLYSHEDGNRFSVNRVKISRNDSQIFEMVSYSRYGGKLAEYRWDTRDTHGRWWTETNKAGRQSDSGDWYLEPAGPGSYRGAWRSQAQTGGVWVPMWVKIE